MAKRVILAVAGAGKTYRICHEMQPEQKNLIVAFTHKLGIQIQSARINAGTVIRPSNIQEILDDKNIVKLVYDNASHYSFRAVNWSYSKGDTYDAVCVILNGSTEKLVEDKFSVSTLKTVTLNKLYVALTRSKGDLYIVTQDEFETVKEKYYK